MKAVVIIFALLTIASCNTVPGNHYKVILDPAFSSDEQSQIVQGLQNWESDVPVLFDVSIAPCSGIHNGEICVHRSSTDQTSIVEPDGAYIPGADVFGLTYTHYDNLDSRGDTSGLFGKDGGETYIFMDLIDQYPGSLVGVSAHEAGHAMGLIHDTIPCLMNPTFPQVYPGAPAPTCDDVRQWYYVRNQSVVGACQVNK